MISFCCSVFLFRYSGALHTAHGMQIRLKEIAYSCSCECKCELLLSSLSSSYIGLYNRYNFDCDFDFHVKWSLNSYYRVEMIYLLFLFTPFPKESLMRKKSRMHNTFPSTSWWLIHTDTAEEGRRWVVFCGLFKKNSASEIEKWQREGRFV